MQGNGESKLCVKESKLCSWNCCWRLLCEGSGEVPPALRLCAQHGCESKLARVKSEEPATGLCCAPSAQALLPGRHWLWLSPASPNGWLGHGQMEFPFPGSEAAAFFRPFVAKHPLAKREKLGASPTHLCRAV